MVKKPLTELFTLRSEPLPGAPRPLILLNLS
jgi:hypothetical protein